MCAHISGASTHDVFDNRGKPGKPYPNGHARRTRIMRSGGKEARLHKKNVHDKPRRGAARACMREPKCAHEFMDVLVEPLGASTRMPSTDGRKEGGEGQRHDIGREARQEEGNIVSAIGPSEDSPTSCVVPALECVGACNSNYGAVYDLYKAAICFMAFKVPFSNSPKKIAVHVVGFSSKPVCASIS